MTKLNDIKGYWDMSYGYEFNDRDMWEGKILLEDDGWFEGIVVDPKSSYGEDRFVFGVYHPDKVIKMFKCTPISVSSSFVFNGTKTDNGYDGEFEVIGLVGSMSCGVSHIITQDSSLVRGNVDSEVAEVKRRIQRYKDEIMDDVGKSFYDNSLAIRNSMCQIVLRNYEGRGFSKEETQEIMDECQPVNERVIHAGENAVKKLVKKISDGSSFDDELPF